MKTKLLILTLALTASITAQQKVSERDALSAGNLDPTTDILPIVDISAGTAGSKSIIINSLMTGWGFTAAGESMAKAADASAQRTLLGMTGNIYNLSYGTALGNLVRLDPTTGKLPAVDGSLLTNLPVTGEPTLGNPGTTGYVLSSTTGGVRSWVAQSGGTILTDSASLRTALSDESGTGAAVFATSPALTTPTLTLGSDATGDIYYRDAGGLFTRLPIGTAGQFLKVTAGLPSWATIAGGGDLLAANNLSDVASAATARTNLGLAIGTNVQAWDADLDVWATTTAPSGAVVGTTDTQTLSAKTLTSPVINVGSDAAGDIYYRNSGGAFTRLAVGTDGHVLTLASGLPSWAAGGGGGLTNWTDAVSTASPNATVPVVSLTATNAASNVDIALSPKGSGAITAQVANSGIGGGNKRGTYAVDLQMVRTSAGHVASGSYAHIGGGYSNSAAGSYAVIGGGRDNIASSDYTVVGGGQQNYAQGNHVTLSGGYNNQSAGLYSSIPGGKDATTRGAYAMIAHSSGMFATQGDSQSGNYKLQASVTSATPTEATLGRAAAASTTRIGLPNNSTYEFTARGVARSDGDLTKTWRFSGTIRREASAATTALVGSVTETTEGDAGASAWDINLTADTTNGSLKAEVIGHTSGTTRFMLQVDTIELVY